VELCVVTVPNNAWVFDTGPLRHFAMQGWLGVLRFLAGAHPVYIPDSVERELYDAAEHVSAARAVLDAGWINVHRSTSRDFIEAFAHYPIGWSPAVRTWANAGLSPWAKSTSVKW
jgi:hypothetical protein